jgi:hypothetical protein
MMMTSYNWIGTAVKQYGSSSKSVEWLKLEDRGRGSREEMQRPLRNRKAPHLDLDSKCCEVGL